MSRRLLPILIFLSIYLVSAIAFSQTAATPAQISIQQNVSLKSVYAPATVSTNSSFPLLMTLDNNGALATGNITLQVLTTGPASFNDSYRAIPLSPLQNESLMIYNYNRSSMPGTYTVSVTAEYTVDGVAKRSNTAVTSYTVVKTQQQQTASSLPILRANGVDFTYVPIYVSLSAGESKISELGIKNTRSTPESINISVGGNYTNFVQLSASNIYLQQNQTIYLQLLFKPGMAPAQITTYTIPMNLSITALNGTTSTATEYITLEISNSSIPGPLILNQVVLNTNETANYISGTLQIIGSPDYNIGNSILQTFLPAGIAKSASQITAYGLQANISSANGGYAIKWLVPYLPKGQSLYAYYTIKGLVNNTVPFNIQNIFSELSSITPQTLLRIINISLPTLYTNSTNTISVTVRYTGTQSGPVYFYLTAPEGTTIYNSSQEVNVTPNQLISRSFGIAAGNHTGTLILTMHIVAQKLNITYSLPMQISQRPSAAPTTTKGSGGIPGAQISESTITYAEYSAGLILIGLLIYGAIVLLNRSRNRRKRSKKLMEIKNQIRSGSVG
jgi:hypothetical protein